MNSSKKFRQVFERLNTVNQDLYRIKSLAKIMTDYTGMIENDNNGYMNIFDIFYETANASLKILEQLELKLD
jgi:hypothetical protein